MKEQGKTNNIQEEKRTILDIVKFPTHGIVNVEHIGPYRIISRMDARFAVQTPARKFARKLSRDADLVAPSFESHYRQFANQVAFALGDAFSEKPGGFNLDIFASRPLDEAAVAHSGLEKGAFVISLDPLIPVGSYENGVDLQTSRGFLLGGREQHYPEQVARPGSTSLEEQTIAIAGKIIKYARNEGRNTPKLVILEDDNFTGGTLKRSMRWIKQITELCKEEGVHPHVAKIALGIQVGEPAALLETGIPLDPVAAYKSNTGDIFKKVDYLDMRDVAFGFDGSGYVVLLPDGTFGRAPVPFVNAAERISIPEDKEEAFIDKVLEANMRLFQEIKTQFGSDLLLRDMSSDFSNMLLKVYGDAFGLTADMPMTVVVQWTRDNLKAIQKYTKNIEEKQKKMHNISHI